MMPKNPDPDKRCYFCQAPAKGECFWPVTRFVDVPVSGLEIGDVVRRYNDDLTPVIMATVDAIEHGSSSRKARVHLRHLDKHGHRTERAYAPIEVWPSQNFKARRTVPCGLSVCEAHLAARAPGKYVCSSHWNAWSEAA